MAVLPPPGSRNPFAARIGDSVAPEGTFAATVIDVNDEFAVTRKKFQSNETETVDLATFLFGFRDGAGNPHMVASKRMRISGNEKSALYLFLKAILGKAPEYGWDYAAVKGMKCLITVEHVEKNGGQGVFAAISSISPMPSGGIPQRHAPASEPADDGGQDDVPF